MLTLSENFLREVEHRLHPYQFKRDNTLEMGTTLDSHLQFIWFTDCSDYRVAIQLASLPPSVDYQPASAALPSVCHYQSSRLGIRIQYYQPLPGWCKLLTPAFTHTCPLDPYLVDRLCLYLASTLSQPFLLHELPSPQIKSRP